MHKSHNSEPRKHNRVGRSATATALAIAALAACTTDKSHTPSAANVKVPESSSILPSLPERTLPTSNAPIETTTSTSIYANRPTGSTASVEQSSLADTKVAISARSLANDIEAMYLIASQDPRHYSVASSVNSSHQMGDSVTKFIPNADGTFKRYDFSVSYDSGSLEEPYSVYSPIKSVAISEVQVATVHEGGRLNPDLTTISADNTGHWEIMLTGHDFTTASYTTAASSLSADVIPISAEGAAKLSGYIQNTLDDVRLTPGAALDN
jgi:hypothetical protein